jgi:serine protease AprX
VSARRRRTDPDTGRSDATPSSSKAAAGEAKAEPKNMPAGEMTPGGRMREPGSAAAPKKEPPPSAQSVIPAGEMTPSQQAVLVQMRMPRGGSMSQAYRLGAGLMPGFQIDASYTPIPMRQAPQQTIDEELVVVRGFIEEGKLAELKAHPQVTRVDRDDAVFRPFASIGSLPAMPVLAGAERSLRVTPMLGVAPCPIGVCDCDPLIAKGTIADVVSYLGVDQIWASGYRGDGIVVGVVDGGIAAIGRTPKAGETARIARVIGGFPSDWGTTAAAWDDHGNMCATDVLGMAPNAQLYDIRISVGTTAATISAALAGFQWAIDQHRANGTPHILTNSWGIFAKDWDAVYATDPNHIFTQKVEEAISEGIVVLFAAGNCGETCPDGRCGADTGPGRSIWGANGHPRVITVGAVNKDEQFVGYSSQGPAALDVHKPDFCSLTHFQGYFSSDTGTSAATPIAAGVIALLKQSSGSLTQDEVKDLIRGTAKDIGPPGWDQHSGAGILQAKAAWDRLVRPDQWHGWEDLGGIITAGPAVASWAPNRLDCFVKGSDNHVWHKWWDGAVWQGWEDLEGPIDGAPAAVSWGPNRIDCFARGMDNHLWHKWWGA